MPVRLKPQDVVLALKLVAIGREGWTQPALAKALHVSAAEVNHGLKRLAACHLYLPRERRIVRANLQEFLVSGLRYVFPAEVGGEGAGLPTAHSAPPLAAKVRAGAEAALVWPSVEQTGVRGRAVSPLYPSAPRAAADDGRLHELLALADGLRIGRARERALAREALERHFSA